MADEWKPLPIPMLPANDERATRANFAQVQRAEREALAMMEKAKAMMVETETAGLYQKPRSL